MKTTPLYTNPNIEVRPSMVHGYGVFAKKDLEAGEILDECSFIPMETPGMLIEDNLKEYMFSFPKLKVPAKAVMVLGLGAYFNHSDNFNATWETDEKTRLFIFKTVKSIKSGHEICTYYGGDDYWKQVKPNKI